MPALLAIENPRASTIINNLRLSTPHRPRSDSLARLARKHRLSLIVLFGSQTAGRIHEESDVDIAVLPTQSAPFRWMELYGDLVRILRNDRVDIVNMRSAPGRLAQNISNNGMVLYSASTDEWPSFRLSALKGYDDVRRFEKYYMMHVDRFLREQGVKK